MCIDKYLSEISKLCNEHNVKSLYAFESALSNMLNERSDVDMVVDIDSNDPGDYAENYFNLKFELVNLLKRPIILYENKRSQNSIIQRNMDQSKSLIFRQ
jgi:uncharacterized protein